MIIHELSRARRSLSIIGALAFVNTAARAQVDARMLRQPAVSATQIAFVYGGSVTAPDFAIHGTKGEWIIENHSVDPDVPVVDDPALMAKGRDPQLERAIQEVMSRVQAMRKPVAAPPYPKRIAPVP